VLPVGGLAYVTESGAFKALTLDLCDQLGLALPAISNVDSPALRAAIPDFVPVSNPLDITAQALVDPDLYRRALAALVDDPRFGSVVLGIIQTDPATCDLKFPHIIKALVDLKPVKPVIFAGLDEGAVVPAHYVQQLRDLQVPYFPSPDRALRAIARLAASALPTPATGAAVTRATVADVVLPAVDPVEQGVIAEWRAKQLLAPAGIEFPPGRFARTVAEALAAAAELGFPVVLKAQSRELSHKSDAGGVLLGLADAPALQAGWQQLHENIALHRPGLELEGVLVEKMGEPGVELIIGARNDPDWGVVVLAGFGGVQAEILKDVRLMTPDMGHAEIVQELACLKSAALLQGFRGSPTLDVDAVALLIARLSHWLQAHGEVGEVDLNPVIVHPVGRGALALDALMQVGAQ
jgi:acyl-CoA synthetase (NDP forming)